MCVCLSVFSSPGEDGRREAADDQSSERRAASGRGSPGATQEAPTESDAEGERGTEGQYY